MTKHLIPAAFNAIGSVFAPGMLGVFIWSVILTLSALTVFIAGITTVAAALTSGMEFSGIWAWLSGIGATLVAYFLFPGIMPLIVNFFDNKIATIIEAEDYPSATPIEPPFWPEFWHDVRFSLGALTLNILILPIYLVPVIGQLAFYILNGHLLGKEFFVMVARRYLPLEDAIILRRKYGRVIFTGGVILTILATIPFINLFAPFWGIAVMTHLYHSFQPQPEMEIMPPATV